MRHSFASPASAPAGSGAFRSPFAAIKLRAASA
jgi:hypothetical protein